jgi:hypothetical protein
VPDAQDNDAQRNAYPVNITPEKGTMQAAGYGVFVARRGPIYAINLTSPKLAPSAETPPGHGGTARELTTRRRAIMQAAIKKLTKASTPETYCNSLQTAKNCPRLNAGPIDLDADFTPLDREVG